MASAIVRGLLARDVIAPTNIRCLSGPDGTGAALAAQSGIIEAQSPAELLDGADTLVLACKPQQLATLDPALQELSSGRLLISILAGKRLAQLAEAFPKARNVVRTMPNTPGQIGAGITAWSSLAPLPPDDRRTLEDLLGALGEVVAVEESQLDAVTALSGSGPAFVFEFAAALREGGISAGLSPEIAARLALETLLGSARLLKESALDPETLRDQVTSPNGTTFAGLRQLEARGFRSAIRETIIAAKERSEELSREK